MKLAAAQRVGMMRWRFLALLFAMAFLSYALRQVMQVAGEQMMPELRISELQMGWIYSAFVWGYALFQFPGGILGERLGPRRALFVIGVLWLFTSFLTGFVPGVVQGVTATVVALMLIRFLVGAVHAPVFPVQALAIQAWFPQGRWAFPQALTSAGVTLGAAMTQPVIAWVTLEWGWRAAFYVFIPLGVVLFAVWSRQARDNPADHPGVGPAELAYINRGRIAGPDAHFPGAWRRLLRNRDTLLLATSYFSMNYVFYVFFTRFFHYLVKVRQFSILETGFLAALPWITGALMAVAGGWTCDMLCDRLGPRWGCRVPAMAGLIATAGLLYAGLFAENAYVAVALLSLCFAATQFTEGAFWQAQTFVAGSHTGAATGIMNTGGNLAGMLVGPLVPWLAGQVGWIAALNTGVLFALFGAGLWLMIRADRPMEEQ